MMNQALKALCFVAAMSLSTSVLAAGGNVPLDHAETDVFNTGTLQRGAKTFMNYCSGCHSMQYMRYSRLMKDLELTEEQLEENFIFGMAKPGDLIKTGIDPVDQQDWFGAPAPDLSLVARSRGVNWLYTYLRSFYPDPSRPMGWNNIVFQDVSMPHVLWEYQGIREPVKEAQDDGHGGTVEVVTGWNTIKEGTMTEAEYDAFVLDLVSFLEYAGEPAKLQRQSLGIWVLLYLSLFTFLAYLLKAEFWRDVH